MLYFAYGSNLNMKAMEKMCPNAKRMLRVQLKDFKLTFNVYADIVKEKGCKVYGALYKVSKEDILPLDEYEEYPKLYSKENIIVEDENGDKYEAFAYTMVNKGVKDPEEKYYKIIEDGYKDWNITTEYLEEAKNRYR